MPAVPAGTPQDLPEEATPYNVLLTGFGPFGSILTNPSWEAVNLLTGAQFELPRSESRRRRRTAWMYTTRIPVSYKTVNEYVPTFHASNLEGKEGSSYDLIIHVGVGLPDNVILETRARRWGYDQEDIDGALAPAEGVTSELPKPEGRRGFFGPQWDDLTDGLETDINTMQLRDYVKSQGVEHLKSSDNAGLFLCEYIYYCSLAYAQAAITELARPADGYALPALAQVETIRTAPHVLFIHVPPEGKPYSVEQLSEIIKLVVQGVAVLT